MNAPRANYVLLRAGALRLLLPQADVGAAEYLEARPERSEVPGLLRSPDLQDTRTFAALSDAMTLLPECPPERFIACELAGAANRLVWCWDEVRVLIGAELQPIPVPPALLIADPPVADYVELEGAPAFLCTAAELCRYALEHLEAGDAT